ncbi:MAG: phage tail tape measure protein, partial [Planctomycetales bacterium]|nr:phage tail tape measure protein [Planctomycetales bacterium]
MAEPEPIIQRIVVEFDDREAQERLARFNDAQARTTERGVGGAASAGAVQMGAFKGGLLAVEAAASLATRAVAGLQRAFNTLKAPVNLGASFQAQIAFIRTLGQELPRGFEAGALELQTRLPQLGADINRALYDAISAGIDPGKALGFVEAASAAAVAGGTDLVKATNTLTTATNAFTELGGDAAKAGDILFATIRAGKTTFEELAATDLGASMASLSVRLAESGALLAEFTKRGQNTSVSLNTIQAIVASIAQPTQEAAREFDRLGVKVGAAALKERGLTAILRDLNTAAGGNVEVISRLTDRKEALRGLLPLLTGGFDAYEKTLRMVETTTGATAQAAREQDNTFEGMQRRLDALVRG